MITKAMLAKCQNESGQAFEFLPKDVQQAMLDNKEHLQRFNHYFKESPVWCSAECDPLVYKERVFRLSPDTPTTDVDWVEVPVTISRVGSYRFVFGEPVMDRAICHAPAHVSFIGIVYEKDGVETLRTSVDAAFGTPKRVRMRK